MGQKRSFTEYRDGDKIRASSEDEQELQQTPGAAKNLDEAVDSNNDTIPLDPDEWKEVSYSKRKKPKKISTKEVDRHPAITHSHQARLQKQLAISDFQTLVLYLLTDSPAPSWVSVSHRSAITKVVTLMVPGLELGMFNGQIPFDQSVDDEVVGNGMSGSVASLRDKQRSPGKFDAHGASNGHSISNTTSADKPHTSPDDYYPVKLDSKTLPTVLKPFASVFPHVWPVHALCDNRYTRVFSPIFGILTAPIPKAKEEKRMKGSKWAKTDNVDDKRTPITEFVATVEELQENEFPMHPAFATTDSAREAILAKQRRNGQTTEEGWVDTRVKVLDEGEVPDAEIETGSLTAGRRVIALDCEMCKTVDDQLSLTRVSLLEWDGSLILDKLVKPAIPIKDYLTAYSGITQEMLDPVTTTLADVQKLLLEIITPQTILIGHSIDCDLRALKIAHPFIVDTALLYPHPRGPPLKSALQWLVQKYLHRDMKRNMGVAGHDSIEDARAVLDLVKLKCAKGPIWGTADANHESILKRLRRTQRPKSNTDAEEFKVGAVVDWGDPAHGHGAAADVVIGCENDEQVVDGIRQVVKDDTSKPVDFVWGRLRELEVIRGWWTDSKSRDTEMHRQAVYARYPGADRSKDATAIGPEILEKALAKAAKNMADIYAALPACTAFVVYSGHGDLGEVIRLQALQQQFKSEYATKKWDELTVRWTDEESQALRQAVKKARQGVGFVVVK
jgi:RNA exonuclease 1